METESQSKIQTAGPGVDETTGWSQVKPPELERSRAGMADAVLILAVLGGYWALALNQLRVDWTINPQYYYGWVVPLLALGLFHLRWISRPVASPPRNAFVPGLIAAVTAALLLPIRLAEEANPEWRLVLWAHAVQAALLTLCALYYAGGWSWVKHCAFPVCFLLVAVPWPVPLEQFVIQNLMRTIAAITVEVVGWLNIPAVQFGNVIQISAGLVGIDEACSGVRSVQTTLFASLFLGELYRFSVGKRFGLTVAGILVALGANLARTSFLVWCAARRGLDQMHRLHDTAGLVALVIAMAGLWVLAQAFRGKKSGQSAPLAATAGLMLDPVPQSWARMPPRPVLLSLAAWIFLAEFSTEFWYHSHESRMVENSRWSIDWPAAQSEYGEVPISDTVRAMLRYSEGREVSWRDDEANQWLLFLFRWAPGRNSVQLAKTHTPDICLRGVGYQLTEDLGTRLVQTQGLELPFSRRVFNRAGEPPLYVFYCLWEERGSQASDGLLEDGILNIKNRLLAIREGRRHLGQQVLEIAIRGPASAEEAAAIFQSQISRLIRR